jgi:hypothetical protein
VLNIVIRTGTQIGKPPTGGASALDVRITPSHTLVFTAHIISGVRNIQVSDLKLSGTRYVPFAIGQCLSYGKVKNTHCNTSKLKIYDISFSNVHGSSASYPLNAIATMKCSSAAGGCTNIEMKDVSLKNSDNGKAHAARYSCDNVKGTKGFKCTGKVGWDPTNS